MNQFILRRHGFALFLLALPLWICGAQAQDDPIETLRQYPADGNIINQNTIRLGIRMLEWQIEQDLQLLNQHDKSVHQLRDEIREEESQLATGVEKSLGPYAYTSEAVRSELIGRILERLLETRLDIAAGESVVSHYEQRLKTGEIPAFSESAFDTQETALAAQAKILEAEGRRLADLSQQRAVSKSIVLQNELKLNQVQTELAKLDAERRAAASSSLAKIADPLSQARVQLLQYRAREKMAERQLEEMVQAARLAPSIRQHQREIEMMEADLVSRSKKLRELDGRRKESQLLLKAIQQRLEETRAGTKKEPTAATNKDE